MTNFKLLKFYLVVNFNLYTSTKGIFMIEHHFIVDIFNQFGMANCKHAYIPLPKGFTFAMSDKNFSLRLIQLFIKL